MWVFLFSSLVLLSPWWDPFVFSLYTVGLSWCFLFRNILLAFTHQKKKKNLNKKLPPRYFGPYQVEARVGQVAYKLDLPASTSIHPVFYVYMLQPVVGTVQQAQPFPLLLTEDL